MERRFGQHRFVPSNLDIAITPHELLALENASSLTDSHEQISFRTFIQSCTPSIVRRRSLEAPCSLTDKGLIILRNATKISTVTQKPPFKKDAKIIAFPDEFDPPAGLKLIFFKTSSLNALTSS